MGIQEAYLHSYTAPDRAGPGPLRAVLEAIMKRVVALTVFALIFGVTSAFAQTPSTKNISIRQSIAAAVAHTPLTATVTRTRAASGKSFWHTPWPYVIFGAAAVVVIVAANKGGTSSGGY